MGGGWGCPHEVNDHCLKINNQKCNPGMKGCELAGRYRFADESKNARYWEKKAREATSAERSKIESQELTPGSPQRHDNR